MCSRGDGKPSAGQTGLTNVGVAIRPSPITEALVALGWYVCGSTRPGPGLTVGSGRAVAPLEQPEALLGRSISACPRYRDSSSRRSLRAVVWSSDVRIITGGGRGR
jgi:hypothetical protein